MRPTIRLHNCLLSDAEERRLVRKLVALHEHGMDVSTWTKRVRAHLETVPRQPHPSYYTVAPARSHGGRAVVPSKVVTYSRRTVRWPDSSEAMCVCDRHGGRVMISDTVWVGRLIMCRHCASEEIDRR